MVKLTVAAASYRTCILKGVSGMTNINQLQALVWGGRLESISMPEAGSGFALVKFLTPEGCQKYFEATKNGIEIPGDKKTIVFVERTVGPNSINDVIQNCIEGDATRCVRAVGVEEDWSDMALMKYARGKGQNKREVDRIKRSKNTKGVSLPRTLHITPRRHTLTLPTSSRLSSSASPTSTMRSASSVSSWATRSSMDVLSAMLQTPARPPAAFTSRMMMKEAAVPLLRRRWISPWHW